MVTIEDEPEGTGWVSAPTLVTTEISELILCRFTGEKPSSKVAVGSSGIGFNTALHCPRRLEGTHPDEECLTVYISARNLKRGIPSSILAEEVRVDPNFSEPLHVQPILEVREFDGLENFV